MADHASLASRLDALVKATDAHRRGYDFEQLVGDLFRTLHFTVIPNPGSAKPRQVDLLATRGTEVYLIETKWLHAPATIDDIDNLYTRLQAVPGSVVGMLISYSGFTKEVITRVKERSNTPVLLVSGSELQAALLFNGNLHNLLRRKTKILLVDRDVLLDDRIGLRQQVSSSGRITVPTARTRFLTLAGDEIAPSLSCGGRFGQFVFAQELPDIDWSAGSGMGVAVDIPLPIRSEDEILGLIHRLADMGWATPGARWSIQQSSVNWHGLGAGRFIEALPTWSDRYKDHQPIHHSEELCYTDVCDGGFYTLTANVAAHEQREVRFARLSFQLIGTPLDPTPMRDLCEAFGVHEQVYFRATDRGSITRIHLDQPYETVEPIALLVEAEDSILREPDDDASPKDFVNGLVIANPFRSGNTSAVELGHDIPAMVKDSEYFIVALTEWHPLVYSPVAYHLTGLEYAWSSGAMIVRPTANWQLRDMPAGPGRETRPRRYFTEASREREL